MNRYLIHIEMMQSQTGTVHPRLIKVPDGPDSRFLFKLALVRELFDFFEPEQIETFGNDEPVTDDMRRALSESYASLVTLPDNLQEALQTLVDLADEHGVYTECRDHFIQVSSSRQISEQDYEVLHRYIG